MRATELQINRDIPHVKDVLMSTDKYQMAMYLTMALAHRWMCPHSWTSVWGRGAPLHKAKLVEKGRAPHLSHGLQCNDGVHHEPSHPTLCPFQKSTKYSLILRWQPCIRVLLNKLSTTTRARFSNQKLDGRRKEELHWSTGPSILHVTFMCCAFHTWC